MSAVAAIAIFPVLTFLLFGLARAEQALMNVVAQTDHRRVAEPPAPTDTPATPAIRVVNQLPADLPSLTQIPALPEMPYE